MNTSAPTTPVAPDATVIAEDGSPCQLSSFWAQTPVLLIFYPGDETLVCTAQLCSYRDNWAQFSVLGVTLVGINPAGHARHRAFREHHRFPFPILSDPDQACCRAYGAKAWYGTRRLTVLVAAGREIWRTQTMPFLKPSAATLLSAVRDHLGSGSVR